MICVKNLYFGYKETILRGVSLELKEGEFLGILGPNGSGKSTLLKHILGILQPKSGEILILNKDISRYSIKALGNILGFVPQKSAISLPLLVRDVLLMGRFCALKSSFGGYESKDYEQMYEVSKLLYIEHFLERNVLTLSGGEFQRVLLARALLKKPKILCLDEPTSALDLHYACEILSLCAKWLKQRGVSVIAVLHDLNLAALFCQRIIFLKDGFLRYEGSPSVLLKPDIIKDVYGLTCEVLHHNGQICVIPSKSQYKECV